MAEEPLRLPRADEAEIDPAKFTRYALCADHEEGKHKLRLFRSIFGRRYTVAILIEGLNGASGIVTTGWIVNRGGGRPRLLSAYPEAS